MRWGGWWGGGGCLDVRLGRKGVEHKSMVGAFGNLILGNGRKV